MYAKAIIGFALIFNTIIWWILSFMAMMEPGLSTSSLLVIVALCILNTLALGLAADSQMVRE
jgi:hypothetical protein